MESLRKFSDLSLEDLLRLRKSVYAGRQLEKAIKAAIESGRRSDEIPLEAYLKD